MLQLLEKNEERLHMVIRLKLPEAMFDALTDNGYLYW